ncbi:MAG: hypothetical protein AMXMBFR7_14970 [Planctomycetota bacterium]
MRTPKLAPRLALALLLAVAALAVRAEDAPKPPAIISVPTLTQEAAEQIVAAAKAKAAATDSPIYKGQKTKMHVYVLGREGTLLAGTQAVGAWPGSADIAMRKARTSWFFKLPTRTIGQLSRTDQEAKAPLYGIEHSNGGLISFPGGLPIFDAAGVLCGAIGVSGDTVDCDELVAQAGVDKAKELGAAAIAQVPSLSSYGASLVLHAALKKCASTESDVYKGQKVKMHIYVLGAEGTVLAAGQQDDAWPGSADIAQRKARTSWCFKLPTGTIGSLSRLDQEAKAPLYGIEHSNTGLITFPGGLPIFDAEGRFVGSVGVSGDSVGKDHEVAQAGVDGLKPQP